MAVDGVPDGWEVVTPGTAPSAPVNAAAQFARGPQAVVDVPLNGQDSRSQLQKAAHPQTDSDVMGLITAPTDLTRGAIENLPTILKAATELPGDLASGAKSILSGAKEQAGNLLMNAAHPQETLTRIAKHLIGSEEPDPMELEAARNELAAMKMRLQAARSTMRQAQGTNALPASPEVQGQAAMWLDTINKATTKSPIVDASGKAADAAHTLSDWDTNFVQRVGDQVKGGWKLSGNQVNQLRRIYQAVSK